MAELSTVADHPTIDSINILGANLWDIMWETNFLMRKRLYFETSGYAGWTASRLEGQWTLTRQDGTGLDTAPSSADTIPINSRYMLKKSF